MQSPCPSSQAFSWYPTPCVCLCFEPWSLGTDRFQLPCANPPKWTSPRGHCPLRYCQRQVSLPTTQALSSSSWMRGSPSFLRVLVRPRHVRTQHCYPPPSPQAPGLMLASFACSKSPRIRCVCVYQQGQSQLAWNTCGDTPTLLRCVPPVGPNGVP